MYINRNFIILCTVLVSIKYGLIASLVKFFKLFEWYGGFTVDTCNAIGI